MSPKQIELTKFANLYDNIHTMFTNKKNERYLYKIYVRLLLNRISESIDTLLLTPHKLECMGVHYNKEPKPNSDHKIWVHTENLEQAST